MSKRIRVLFCLVVAFLFVLCVFTACNTTTIQSVKFKITFDVDGRNYFEIDTQGTEVLQMPSNPTKDDYIFDGWYWDKDTWTRPFTANSLLNEPLKVDMTVYVKWKRDCNHNIVTDKGYAPTCTKDGLTDGSHCSICNDVIVAQEVIPASGHDIKQADAKAPTCTEVGWNAYEYCSKCDYSTKVEIKANGHAESDWIVDIAPKCLTGGHRHKVCEVCHITVAEEDTDALQHDIQQAKAQSPTCTNVGWNAYEYCTRCDYTTKVEIKANGHTEGGWIVDVTPSCETKGHKHKDCTVCGHLLQEEDIVATGHHFSAEWKNDETYHWHNADCGHNLQSEKAKHSFDANWKCTVCNYQDISLHGTELKAKTLSVDGTNLYTKVSNTTETFSFINEIRVADGAIYTVHTDISCSGASELRAKTAPLQIGDNVLYILVSNGNEVALYTVTIRRRPIYTVSFDTKGGTAIASRQIEEGSLTAEPNTSRNGYIFDGWDYNFENAIIADTVISAKWITIVRNIKYTLDLDIEHNNPLTYIYDDETIQLVEKSSDNAYFISWYLNGKYISTLDAHQLVDYNLVGYVGTIGVNITDSAVKSYSGTSNSVIIPSNYKGAEINSIGQNAFKNCNKLKDIVIPDSVTSIDSYAFYNCDGLTNIYYKGDIASWCGISGLGNLMSSSRALYINGEKLKGDLVIPDSVANIGDSAFSGCSGLTSVTIGNSVTSIGVCAFYGCSGLTSVTIPNIVTNIGDSAFSGCSGLTNVTIGNNVTSIGNSAFRGCSGLTSITVPDSVTSIGSFAFSGCSGLATVNWNATACTTTGSSSSPIFNGCLNLTIVNIGDNVTTIPAYAFYNCSGLSIVYYKGDIASWCGISGLGSLMSSSRTLYINGKKLTGDLVIPDSVMSIADYAFCYCSGLTSVIIPGSVKSIGDLAFSGCSGLTSIYYKGDIASWCGISGLGNLMSSDRTLYINGEEVKGDLVITDSATSIGSSAFSGCSRLTSIIIPDSVTSIGERAFYGCSGLTSIAIPDSVTSIGYMAFSGCSGLIDMTIPFVGGSKSATSASSSTLFGYIFGGNSYTGGMETAQFYTNGYTATKYYIPTSLKKVTITGGPILYGAFSRCAGFTSVTVGDSVTSIGEYAFTWCTELASITIGNSVTSIGKDAFTACSGLNAVKIMDMANWCEISFGNYLANPLNFTHALYLNGELVTELIIPDSVTSIGSYAFADCSSIKSITIPDSVASISERAFSGCSGLTSIRLPNSVTNIGECAFSGCSGLTSITIVQGNTVYHNEGECLIETANNTLILGCKNSIIPSNGSVTSIGSYAFSGCSELKRITIPDSVTSIGDHAFDGCRGLEAVYITDLAKWCEISFGESSSSTNVANPLYYAQKLYLNGKLVEGNLIIPEGVTSIGSYAFYGCIGLTSVTIPDSITRIGDYAFGCSGLTTVNWNATACTMAGSYNFPIFYSCENLTVINIGENVTIIPSYAFKGCCRLISITIPNSVASIGYMAFSGCSGLTSIKFNNTRSWYNTQDQVYWENKTNGTSMNVTDTSKNATYLTDAYTSHVYLYRV